MLLADRAAQLRLPVALIAREARLDRMTVHNFLRNEKNGQHRGLARTGDKIAKVIDSYERRMLTQLFDRQRDWLLDQFPDGIKFKPRALPGQRELPI